MVHVRLKSLVRVTAAFLLGGYLLLLLFLNFSPLQSWLTRSVEEELEDILQTEVVVEDLEIGLFNRVILRGVQINDLSNAPLLNAGLMSCKVEFLPLLKGEVSLRTVSVLDADIKLCRHAINQPANYEFLLKLLKKDDKDTPSSLNLRVNSVILRRCNVTYDVSYEDVSPGRFNKNHIKVSDITANISLKKLTPDSLNLRVRSLSFKEQSGIEVNSLTFRLSANKKQCLLEKIKLVTPHSSFSQNNILAKYDWDGSSSFSKSLILSGEVEDLRFSTADFIPFFPALKGKDRDFRLQGKFDIRSTYMSFQDLSLTDNKGQFILKTNLNLLNGDSLLQAANSQYSRLYVSEGFLADVADCLPRTNISSYLTRLGSVNLYGQFQYDMQGRSFVKATLESGAGNVAANLSYQNMKLAGTIQTTGLRTAILAGKEKLPDDFDLMASLDMTLKDDGIKQGAVNCEFQKFAYNGYTYKNLNLDLKLKDNRWFSQVLLKDKNADFMLNASATMNKYVPSNISMTAFIHHLHLKNLHLTNHFSDDALSAKLNVKLKGLSLDSPSGTVQVNDFLLCHEDSFGIDHLQIDAEPSENGTLVSMHSDFGNFTYDGPLSIEKIRNGFERIGGEYVGRDSKNIDRLSCKLRVRLNNTKFIPALIRVPLEFPTGFMVEGGMNSDEKQLLLTFSSDSVVYGENVLLRRPALIFKTKEGKLTSLVQGIRKFGKSQIAFALSASAKDSLVKSALRWDDSKQDKHYGEILADLKWERDNRLSLFVHPTDFAINDTTWHVYSGRVLFNHPSIKIDDFYVGRENQWLKIGGGFSNSPKDSLLVDLKDIDVNYILNLFDIKPVKFNGMATGVATVRKAKSDSIDINGVLAIPNFHFNDALLGDANIHINWNSSNGRICFDNTIIEEKGIGYTAVNGFVSPPEKGLDLQIQSKNTNLAFLNKYLNGILEDVEGRTTGGTRIHGAFKAIDFSGTQNPKLKITIPAIGVRFGLDEGVVSLSPGIFDFSHFRISDKEGNFGEFSGEMTHDHLKNIRYDFLLSEANNLLLYDKPRSVDMPFYATAYAHGNLRLSGEPGALRVNADIRPGDDTKFVYIVDDPSTSSGDSQLLNFVSEHNNSGGITNHASSVSSSTPQKDSKMHLLFHFDINMNPQATLRVITNPKSGDYLDLYTSGNIQANFDSKGDFTMQHPLILHGGIYQMNIQNVINKKLTFKPGGQINFNGNPFKATLNLQAVYTVPSVSLSDLNIGRRLSSTSTPVNCVFLFSGTAGAPQIDFNFELPNASDEVEQMVSDLISTEEDKRMQALYLLGIGRFYTYNYSSTATAENQSQTTVAMKSFLSSTLSSQLNSIIQSALPSNNWSFGANLATGTVGWSDMEIEGILSGKLLSGRLLLNGNFGYKDRTATYSNTHFVGDFDAEYLLTPSGNVSLKAYSKTNDRYFSTSSLTTQGIGIRLSRQFDTFPDLFGIKPKNKKHSSADSITITAMPDSIR